MSGNELVPRDEGESGKPPAKQRRKSYASKSASFRRAMMAAVTEADIYEITKMLTFLARRGDPVATREVLDRTVGKAPSMAEIMEIEARESGGAVGHPTGYGTTLEPADTLDALVECMDAAIPFVPDTPALPASRESEPDRSQEGRESDDAA